MNATVQLSDYQLHLEGFEGPLDVLLRLIEQRKLAVSDVSLVVVSTGFLQYITEMRDPPPQLLADFARVAAKLLVIKSRSLLPSEDDELADDSFDDLVNQLKEYKRARQLALQLQDSEEKHFRAYPGGSPKPDFPVRLRVVLPTISRLQQLMGQVRARGEAAPGVVALSRIVSTAVMTRKILNAVLRSKVRIRFGSIANYTNRSEVVAGFIAVLSLLHSRRIEVVQTEQFGPIYLQSPSVILEAVIPEGSREPND